MELLLAFVVIAVSRVSELLLDLIMAFISFVYVFGMRLIFVAYEVIFVGFRVFIWLLLLLTSYVIF